MVRSHGRVRQRPAKAGGGRKDQATQVVAIGLQKEGGDWKLDSFIGFTKYDPAGLGEVMEEHLAEEEGISPELATCISEGIAAMSKDEAEALEFKKFIDGLKASDFHMKSDG